MTNSLHYEDLMLTIKRASRDENNMRSIKKPALVTKSGPT